MPYSRNCVTELDGRPPHRGALTEPKPRLPPDLNPVLQEVLSRSGSANNEIEFGASKTGFYSMAQEWRREALITTGDKLFIEKGEKGYWGWRSFVILIHGNGW